VHSETSGPGTGPLRNGNPRGNPNVAPRCGAKARTTGCACQAPAMANGRCRMHGGLSTGPRTSEGRARISAANTRHGFYSAETKADLRRTDSFIAETRAFLAALGQAAEPTASASPARGDSPQSVASRPQQDTPDAITVCSVSAVGT